MQSLKLTPFTCNPIWVLFPVTMVHSQFTTLYETLLSLWGGMTSDSERFKLLVTLNGACFPIPPPLICILHKLLFPIMGVDPPYPNFSNDNIFSNILQSTRGRSIWSPLYLSNDLYCVNYRPKCPQHDTILQGYFPVQFPERLVSPKSTHAVPILWSQVGFDFLPLSSLQGYLNLSGWVGEKLVVKERAWYSPVKVL